jgi:hypothetical protein
MRVIVAGSTTWDNAEAIRRELMALPSDTVVIHGDAPGADALGDTVARELDLSIEPFAKTSDDYQRYKRGAWKGLNERMLASGAELVLAFHPAAEKSRGTKHLLRLASAAGVSVKIVRE